MCTDAPVGGKAVLAVVLSDVPRLTYPIPHIKNAVTSGRYGANSITKNFLLPGVESAIVKRGHQSTRRRCTILYLDKIDEGDSDRLCQRKCYIRLFAVVYKHVM
jgi:hypothetical protein